jgi:DNA-binding NarL/FixJ family response regulator
VTTPLRTFLIEDSPLIRQNLVATLEELTPVRVVGGASREDDAVRQLAGSGVDCTLVIVDILLEQGSGLGVLAAPGVQRAGRHFVVLSNYAGSQDLARRALQLGAARVFDKSNDIDALVEHCARLAGARGQSL